MSDEEEETLPELARRLEKEVKQLRIDLDALKKEYHDKISVDRFVGEVQKGLKEHMRQRI